MSRDQFRIALQNLRANRARTFLTVLGIVIGVASITLVLALGEGIRNSVGKQVEHLDENIIIVKPGRSDVTTLSSYNPYNTSMTTSLTERDYGSVSETNNVKMTAPLMLLSGSIKNVGSSSADAPIVATSESLVPILDLKVHSGQFIDEITARETVVLGQNLAIKLFGTDEAMGQSVLVKGRQHTVIGVVKNLNTPVNLTGIDLDNAAYVSLDDGKSFNQGIAQIQQLLVQVNDTSKLHSTASSIDKTLLKNHQDERDFSVLAGQDIATHSNRFFGVIIALTAIVSVITLIVSGIGVMNIMLVGVTERTREIGIRKALGATDRHIMGQYLIESLLICITGGIVGILLAYLVAFVISSQLSFHPSLSYEIVGTGFSLALVVGIVFGLYPALKAANKDPIDALRQYQ